MPIYEYQCQECEKIFTTGLSLSDKTRIGVRCPGCDGKKVKQLISSFVAKTESKA